MGCRLELEVAYVWYRGIVLDIQDFEKGVMIQTSSQSICIQYKQIAQQILCGN